MNRAVIIKRKALRPVWRIKYMISKPEIPKNADGKVYLNLGSGNFTSPEFVNVDAVPFRHTHKVGDILDLSEFPSNSVDMIYASHVIEHINRDQLIRAFKEWLRVLKPGGFLRFGVPHFDSLVEIYNLSGKKVESIEGQLMGQGGNGYDDHHSIWNFAYAEKLLRVAGFKGDIKLWDVNNAEHHSFTDKCNRVFELNGKKIAISLNIEAYK